MPSPRPWSRRLLLLELGGLVLVALACLVFQLRLPTLLPSEGDYRTVAGWLEAEARPGDTVLLFPWWTERARLYLPARVPVQGYLGSDAGDWSAYRRIWVLGQPELPRADAAGFQAAFLPGRTAVGAPRRAGPLEVTLYENGRYRPRRFVASDVWARARVYVESPDGARRDCPFDGRVHRCPGPPHLYLAREWHEIQFAPYQCLWMPPPGGRERLVAEFDDVPVDTEWRLEAGIASEFSTHHGPRLSVTHLGVEDAASRESLLTLHLPPGREGLVRAARAMPSGRPRAVRLWVQADNAESRQVCLDFLALAPGPSEGT